MYVSYRNFCWGEGWKLIWYQYYVRKELNKVSDQKHRESIHF